MRIILGATIGLLALVSAELAVFAYTEHREVAYLTLRADPLERRINDLKWDLLAASKAAEVDAANEAYRRRWPALSGAERTPTPEEIQAANEEYRRRQQSTSTPTPTPGPVAYTDQELLESRDQGPNRPECGN